MNILSHLEPQDIFGYFEALCSMPHGSGNMEQISAFCMDFADKHGLWAYRDEANNVVIKKPASSGYEKAEPVILQGHLDMVCQKDETSTINFETDGLEIYEADGYIHAKGTTLGADNGVAVAVMLAILADNTLSHPPIEAIFTTDEEIGMLGAVKLDMSILDGKRMINMDSEDPLVVTVSCAGGSDFAAEIPVERKSRRGRCVVLTVKGLRGGHSGVEIDKGGENANLLMGRFLNHLDKICDFDIISVDGGDKGNAIPISCRAQLVTYNSELLVSEFEAYAKMVAEEIKMREPAFCAETEILPDGDYEVMEAQASQKLLYALLLAPNGVLKMSAEIENLVETSLNMGILQTSAENVRIAYALRSNKSSALRHLEERLTAFFGAMNCVITTSGHYPPWEYKNDSILRELYLEMCEETLMEMPRVEAIHAGLECGVFASRIPGLDCISIGAEMHGIHTVQEKLSIRSTKELYDIVCRMLASLQ